MSLSRFLMVPLLALGVLGFSPMSSAQGLFSPELQIGDAIVTRYQIDQRARFLTLLGAPGDVRALAREQLINETVQLTEAEAQGIIIGPEQVESGIAEFAGRANLTADQFREIIDRAGIGEATVRDFFTAGVAWREAVRARFGDTLRGSITEAQVRRSLAQVGTEGGLRVLVSEILLPAGTPETREASLARAAKISRLPDEEAFAAAARRTSVAASSARGGAMNWTAFDALPPDVQSAIGPLTPGQISAPVSLENAIGIFLLRDQERVAAGSAATLLVDYALFTTAGGSTEAANIAARVDVCDDFYGVAKGLPEDRLIRETVATSALPADIRAAIARLDETEISTEITRDGKTAVLMLCERRPALDSTVDLEIVGNRLLNTRLGTTAAHYLTQLRASTDVIDFAAN